METTTMMIMMVLFRRRTTPLLLLLLLTTTACLAQEEAVKDESGIVVPTIDLSSWLTLEAIPPPPEESIVQQVRRACETVGFFQILLPQEILKQSTQNAWKATQEFFDLSLEQKLRYKTTNETEYPYGFENVERLAQGKALDGTTTPDQEEMTYDTKETFAMGPSNLESGMPARRWLNDTDPELKSSLEMYYQDMEWLALQLLKVFAAALQQPLDFFERKMTHHMSALRLVNYYALHSTSLHKEEDEVMIRAGAHTDYGALTILTTKAPGLQVFVDGQWHALPYVPNAYIVNLGDLMQRWTNDAWHSTLHRVVMPTTQQRYSMAYFVNVNGDALIESILQSNDDTNHNKYPPIRAGDHLMQKHLASMSTKKTDNNNDDENEYSGEEL